MDYKNLARKMVAFIVGIAILFAGGVGFQTS